MSRELVKPPPRRKPPGKKAAQPTKKRRATEDRIIAAFERVLLKDGAEELGVNSVIKEAGVGKGLLYDYFGGLEGLAEAWVERASFIPGMEEIAGEPLESFNSKTPRQRISQVHVNYATALKKNKLAGRLMSEELLKRSDLSKPLQSIRRHIGENHEAFFVNDKAFMQPDNTALIFVLQAASNYLALRAQCAPIYNGIDIQEEEGWALMMEMIARVAALGESEDKSGST